MDQLLVNNLKLWQSVIFLNASSVIFNFIKMEGAMFSFLKKSNANALIGIDFGSNCIKAIAISKHQGTYIVNSVAETSLEKGLIVDGRFENIPLLMAIVAQLCQRFSDSYKNVAIAVNGIDVITKIIKVNAELTELALESQVEIEAEASISFPIDEIFLDFEVVGPCIDEPEFNDVLMSVARKENVISQVSCIENAGLKAKIVDVASHAQARACDLVFETDDYDKGIVIIDVGASQIMINVVHHGRIVFSRTKNYGGNAYSEFIAERHNLSFSDAEKRKKTNKLPAGCEGDILPLFLKQVINHLQFDLRMFTNTPDNIKLDKIFLTGGCSLLNGFSEKLEEELKIKVEVPDPFSAFEYENISDKKLLLEQGCKYMIALGLALRGGS